MPKHADNIPTEPLRCFLLAASFALADLRRVVLVAFGQSLDKDEEHFKRGRCGVEAAQEWMEAFSEHEVAFI